MIAEDSRTASIPRSFPRVDAGVAWRAKAAYRFAAARLVSSRRFLRILIPSRIAGL